MDVGFKTDQSYRIFYRDETQLDKIVVDQKQYYLISDLWLNEQPAKCLKDFDFRAVNPSTMTDLKEHNGELFIAFNPQNEVSLKVTYQSVPITVKWIPELTGFGLRLTIERKLKLTEFDILEGESCIDESLMIRDYEGGTLTVVENKRETPEAKLPGEENGMGFGCISLIPFVNFSTKITLGMSNDAPKWRWINRGFNLEGKCDNKECSSYQKGNVCILVKEPFGVFHINEVTCGCSCPECKKPLISENITNCIFLDCQYTVTGAKKNDPRPEIIDSGTAKANEPVSYKKGNLEKPVANIVDWKFLKIEVKERYIPPCVLF